MFIITYLIMCMYSVVKDWDSIPDESSEEDLYWAELY